MPKTILNEHTERSKMKKSVKRNLEFELELYELLMKDADYNERSFPRHVAWILKRYLRDVDKQ